MNLRALRTSVRLALGFGAVLAILAIVVVVSSILISQSKRTMMAGLDQANIKTQYANTMRAALLEKGIAMRNIGLQSDVGEMQAADEQVKVHQVRYQQALDGLTKAGLTSAEQTIVAEIARLDKTMADPLAEAVAHALAFDPEQAAKVITSQLEPLNKQAVEQINKLVRAQSAATQAVMDASVTDDRQLMVILYAMGALALVVGAIMAWLTARSITAPLERAVRVAARVAEGDLTARIEDDGRDEIAQLFVALRQMNDSLLKTVSQVRQGTDAIASASEEIARGNLDLSSRTEQQAASLEETASSMEELTSTVKNNLDNARQANTLATSASSVASRGGVVVGDVVQTMGAINDSARKIVDIIGVIDGIAFQTNILALNAAVEAARAGEQGRGFAVVASEVRSLAQRSAAAAREIKGLIDDSVSKVQHGNTLVGQAGATMDEVVDSVKRVTDIMAEIMAASEEQSSGIEQVNQAISQMDQVTQQNAALVEEAAAASAAMQDQARQLANVVSVFRISEGAASAPVVVEKKAEQRPRQQPPAVPARSTQTPVVPRRKAPALHNTSAQGDWEEF